MPAGARKKIASKRASAAPEVPKGSGLRDDLKRFTRDRILNAAMSSFQDIGFKETTVERIVDLAGTTAPTFYRHFNGKNDLLPPLQDYLAEKVQGCLGRLNARDIESPQALQRWIGDYMAMWNEVHRLCKAFWDATAQVEEMTASTFVAMFDTGGTIDRLFPQIDEASIVERKFRLGLLMLMLDRLANLVAVAPDNATREKLISCFAEMMWRTVFADLA